MGQKRSKSWYEEEHHKIGIDIFNKSIHIDRAVALAKLIAADKPKKIFEFAAGGSVLAREVLKLLPDSKYFWNDFSQPAIDDAQKKLKDLPVTFPVILGDLDIDKSYNIVSWHSFDAVVCVSIEHLENDRKILQAIPPGRKIYLSIPNIDAPDHIRVLSTNEEIIKRYGDIIDIKHIEDCGTIFKLVVGVR